MFININNVSAQKIMEDAQNKNAGTEKGENTDKNNKNYLNFFGFF